jgi:hypothetical protein
VEDALRMSHVSQILTVRGMSVADITMGTGHMWHHPYMRHYGGAKVEDEVARINAADKAEAYVFFRVYTEFTSILAKLRLLPSSFVYLSKKFKYKQDLELVERAYAMTMEGLVKRARRAQATLTDLLEDLPSVIHNSARKIWTASNTHGDIVVSTVEDEKSLSERADLLPL